MIELTTGVVFLMSSLYGTGHSNGQVWTVEDKVDNTTKIEQISTEDKSTLTDDLSNDAQAMEAYLQKEFADTPIMVDIARCESTFRHTDENGSIIRGRVNSADVGVMQINEKYHGEMATKLGIDIYTLEGNVEYAKHLYRDSGGKPWSASSKCWNKDIAINK
ncbi:MAG: hypothetical protein WC648_01355 [Candidatus Paceibacterota bacterium]|jgi:ribosomal protein S13